MNPKHAANIHNFVEQRYADFCTSADQHDDHKQTLMELAESAAVVDVLKEAIEAAQVALDDARPSVEAWVTSDGDDSDREALASIDKALATIATALKEIDE